VNVNGVLYDVAFRDGTAIDLYNMADNNTDFPFTNLSNLNDVSLGMIANQALLDQVLVGVFDSAPNLINGINTTGAGYIWTLLWVNSSGALGILGVDNDQQENGDVLFSGSSNRTFDTGWWSGSLAKYDSTVYAAWSKTSSAPIPGAVWLFVSGVIGLVGIRRIRKK
jgi:hypothetical protein